MVYPESSTWVLKLENRAYIETLAEKLWQIANCSEKY